jgi:hypothetical protein
MRIPTTSPASLWRSDFSAGAAAQPISGRYGSSGCSMPSRSRGYQAVLALPPKAAARSVAGRACRYPAGRVGRGRLQWPHHGRPHWGQLRRPRPRVSCEWPIASLLLTRSPPPATGSEPNLRRGSCQRSVGASRRHRVLALATAQCRARIRRAGAPDAALDSHHRDGGEQQECLGQRHLLPCSSALVAPVATLAITTSPWDSSGRTVGRWQMQSSRPASSTALAAVGETDAMSWKACARICGSPCPT